MRHALIEIFTRARCISFQRVAGSILGHRIFWFSPRDSNSFDGQQSVQNCTLSKMRAGAASSDSTLDTVFREARDSSPKRTVFAPVNKACIEKESKMTDSNATSNLGHILHVWRANGIESRSFPVHCDIHPVQHEDV